MTEQTQSESTALAPPTRQQFDLSPQTFEQALTFSNYLADSDLVPKDFKGKPSNCLVAMQWGAEIGLKPLQALQNIAVINGRPALWGDSVIALVRSSPLCEYVIESDDGHTATCKVKRRGEPEQVRQFSMDDAKAAGLSGKQGPWTQYPKRMRQMRARAFALRDVFPDVLRGLPVAEELMDIPVSERNMGAAEVVQRPDVPAFYDQAQFEANFHKWRDVIASCKQPASRLISFIESKGAPLTEEQKAKLLSVKAAPATSAQEATDVQTKSAAEKAVTYAQVADRITKATSHIELDDAETLIGAVDNPKHREELSALLEKRQNELTPY